MSAFTALESVRDALAAVSGVQTCKIGMEAGITPADYPLVRVVPSTITDGVPRGVVDQTECMIYFGLPIHEFAAGGLESLYEQLLSKRAELLAAARAATAVASVVHIETILDEDRIDAYKLMAMRVKIVG